MGYTPPLKDMRFVLDHVIGLPEIAQRTGYEHATPDMVEAVLTEAARLSSEVWAETNKIGDRQGCKVDGVTVKTPEGFKDAYKQFADGGWNAMTCTPDHGGQGLPWSLGMAVGEMWQSANLALSLCPLLTAAAIEAIEKHGSAEQKHMYLPNLISGAWAGTMNLTEPQAGSDLAAIKTTAKKNGDHYVIKGQKIYITFGEHDFTPNIIHLVLAHIDGLPDGNDGLGLFIVPKFMVGKDGSLGARNDLHVVSIEHKLGIHGSPTCVMQYGDKTGAIGYLVGEEGKGLRNMFTMMNNARISVGLQGVALSEAAYQHALWYAKERVQGAKIGDKSGKRVAIIEHADVRRMLMTMKSTTEAARALAYTAGAMIDRMRTAKNEEERKAAEARVDLLTPLVKAWSTDLALETTSMGVQIHGGMGFVEETGAAQFYRDARILPIYEGTNGIQANDLVYRKVLRDGGAEAARFVAEMKTGLSALQKLPGDDVDVIVTQMGLAVKTLEETTAWVMANAKSNSDAVASSSALYLKMFATVGGGFMMALAAKAASEQLVEGGDGLFLNAKLASARFFAEAVLPQIHGLKTPIMGGCKTACQIANDQF